jgi:hypothetical protein
MYQEHAFSFMAMKVLNFAAKQLKGSTLDGFVL